MTNTVRPRRCNLRATLRSSTILGGMLGLVAGLIGIASPSMAQVCQPVAGTSCGAPGGAAGGDRAAPGGEGNGQGGAAIDLQGGHSVIPGAPASAGQGGEGATGIDADGSVHGAGGAGGGVGTAVGGVVTGGTGGDGSPDIHVPSGGGGGGAGVYIPTGSVQTLAGFTYIGGAGGDGGAPDTATGGGGGGGGGAGFILGAANGADFSVVANASVTGGVGGRGGESGLVTTWGGGGGGGGDGVLVIGTNAILTIDATGAIAGGAGGAGGLGTVANGGDGASGTGIRAMGEGLHVTNNGTIRGGAGTGSGAAGVGIITQAGASITNAGTLAGGIGAAGRASSVLFNGAGSMLTLQSGSSVAGAVELASGASATIKPTAMTAIDGARLDGGGAQLLLDLTSSSLDMGSSIIGAGDVSSFGTGTLTLHDVNLTGSLDLNSSGGVGTSGGTVGTTGLQHYAGPVQLGDDTTFVSTGGSITFDNAIDGAHALEVDATAGDVHFGGPLGGTTALSALTVRSNTLTIGSLSAGALDLAVSSGITQSGAFSITGGSVFQTGGDLILTNAGNSFGGAVQIQAANIDVSASGDLHVSSLAAAASGDIALTSGGTLTLPTSGLSTQGTITLRGMFAPGKLSARSIVLDGVGGLVFGDNVTATEGLTLHASGDISQSAGKITAGTINADAGSHDILLTRPDNAIDTIGDVTARELGIANGKALTFAGDVHVGTLDLNVGSGVSITGSVTADTVANIHTGTTLTVGNGGTSGSITGNVTNNDTLTFDRSDSYTFGGVISGSGTVNQIGAGTTILTGNNSYSGGTQVRGGTLVAQGGNAIGDLSLVLVFNGGTFRVADDETVAALAGSGGTVDLDGADLTFGWSFANLTASYPGSITGTGGLVKQGAFKQVLSGNNSYQGATQILGGTLYAVGTGIDSIPDASAVTVAAGATLSLVQPFPPFAGEESDDETIGSLAGAGNVDLGAQVLTIGGNSANTTFSGVIAGVGGSLIKTGSGTTVLNGANSYTGPTTVAAGTLVVGDESHPGAMLTSSVGVNSGATLGGHGTIGGNVDLAAGSHLSPGGSIGTLNVGGDLTAAQGTQLDFEFGAPGPNPTTFGASDNVHVGGNLELQGAVLNVADAGGMGPGLYNLFTYGGSLSMSNGGLVFGTTPPGGPYQIQILTGEKEINLVDYTGATLNFWNANGLASPAQLGGGDGTWTTTSPTWTNATGSVTAAMQPQPGFAIFGGAAGTVTVDNSAGPVTATGMQFASDGYALTGGTLTLVGSNGAAPIIRVGDGSSDSAAWTATIGNVIAGNTGLAKADLGTLVLTGANTYTGGTTINGGTLQLGDGGTFGSIVGDVTNNGTLAFNRSDVLTFGGAISGIGALNQIGTGTTVLSGTNSYTGPTTVAAGTLQAGVENAFSQASATVVNTGGTLDLGGFAQAIDAVSLAGGTIQNGALAGAVTSTGGTVADLGGSASLTTQAGLTTVQGTNSYTGPTTVAGGALVVGDDTHAGASLASAVTVNGGGTLGGIGTIGGLNVASGGTVAPGNSIGTLTVAGNASFAAGSTYQVEINPAGASDRLAVTGTATLGGTVALTKAAGLYAPGTRYTILTAGGGVSGAFGGLTQDMPFVDLALGYDPNDVYLDIVRNTVPFPAVGITRNEVATAAAVEALGQGNTVYNAVVGQPTAAGARQAFNALSGEIYASAQGVMLDDSRYIREAVGDRLRQGLAPETGTLAALAPTGPALAYAPQPVIKGPLGKDAARVPAVLAPAYALWGEGFGAWGRRGSDGNASGLDTSVGGFVLGADAPVGDQFRVGVAGGYSRTSLDGNTGSSADLDTYYAALYGGGQWGPLGVRLGAAYSWHDLDATRAVVFPGFAETLKGSRDANTTQAFGEIGYRVALGGVALEPFAGLAYVNLETDAFTEQGGAAGLTGLSGSEDVTFTSLGVRAAQRFVVGATTALTLRGTVGWQHAFGDTTPSAAFLFAGGSLPFTVAGVPIAEDALVVKAGADLDIGPAVTLGVAYSAQFAPDAQDQQVKGVLNVKF
jgi:outer membrane autotransporter protein